LRTPVKEAKTPGGERRNHDQQRDTKTQRTSSSIQRAQNLASFSSRIPAIAHARAQLVFGTLLTELSAHPGQ
jgi:hypothetical protein